MRALPEVVFGAITVPAEDLVVCWPLHLHYLAIQADASTRVACLAFCVSIAIHMVNGQEPHFGNATAGTSRDTVGRVPGHGVELPLALVFAAIGGGLVALRFDAEAVLLSRPMDGLARTVIRAPLGDVVYQAATAFCSSAMMRRISTSERGSSLRTSFLFRPWMIRCRRSPLICTSHVLSGP
jgi:hypothetical protein